MCLWPPYVSWLPILQNDDFVLREEDLAANSNTSGRRDRASNQHSSVYCMTRRRRQGRSYVRCGQTSSRNKSSHPLHDWLVRRIIKRTSSCLFSVVAKKEGKEEGKKEATGIMMRISNRIHEQQEVHDEETDTVGITRKKKRKDKTRKIRETGSDLTQLQHHIIHTKKNKLMKKVRERVDSG